MKPFTSMSIFNVFDHRSGFSAIELAVVLVIISVLVGISAGQILPTLRRASVNEAVGLINEANQQARILSLRGGTSQFGVRINHNIATAVQIVTRTSASSGDIDLALVGSGNAARSIFDVELDEGSILWLGDRDFASAEVDELLWFFDHSGRLIDSSGKVSHLGLLSEEFTSGNIPWTDKPIAGSVDSITPASSADTPGLSLRSPNNDYVVAISIGPLGTFFDREITQ